MRHWLLTSPTGENSFVITGDMETPIDRGYDASWTYRRLATEPGAFDTVDESGVVAESLALRSAQPVPLPRTLAALDVLIADRIAATSRETTGG